MTVKWRASPNFGPRRNDLRPSLIVLHYTAMASARAALERLCDPQSEVSAHYLIAGNGCIWQMVCEDHRAWHAGVGEWAGQDDINSRSVGIELDNRATHPFGEPQMHALEHLLAGIMARWEISAAGVIGHSCMAPGRKYDPGPRFDWARLARLGLAKGMGTNPVCPPNEAKFRALARAAGFSSAIDDKGLLDSVRLRFRPWGRGVLSGEDMSIF